MVGNDMSYNMVVELGTTHTSIYKKNVGIVLKEPSVIAFVNDGKKKVLKGVGTLAKNMALELKDNVNVVDPIVEGVVVNKQLASIMLQEFLKLVGVTNYSKEKIGLVVPVGLNDEQKNRILSLVYSLNFNTVSLLPSVVCALSGMEIDLVEPVSHMVVIVGGGVTDIGIINGSNIVRACTVNTSGKSLSVAISQYLRDEHDTVVGESTHKKIRHELLSLLRNDKSKLNITGLDVDTKTKKEIVVTATELLPIVKNMYDQIANSIETLINMSSGDVVSDITKYGIYVCGGMSNVTGLERYLRERLKYPTYIDTDPFNTVINGAGLLLQDSDMIKKVALNK